MARIVEMFSDTGVIGLPAALVDGEPVAFGVPCRASGSMTGLLGQS